MRLQVPQVPDKTPPVAGAAGDAGAGVGFGTPFADQLAFFRRKLNLPTEQWDDILRSAHDRAFIVAGAAKADLLQDLRGAVDSTMASGGGLGEFRAKFRAVVATHGWTGWTGEGSTQGEAWRTRVIYQTNMATSYAAGRWQQLNEPGFAARRPYWQYLHADGQLHPRPLHLAWDKLTLPREHPFWAEHFPPNGWGCRCEVRAVVRPELDAPTAPPAGWDKPDPKTGVPVGIDRGFDYAPGARAAAPMQTFIDDKLLALDAPIGAAMWRALKPTLAMERQAAWWDTLDTWLADPLPRGRTATVGVLSPGAVAELDAAQALPANAAIEISDALVVGRKQRRHVAAQDGLTDAEWRSLTTLLDAPAAVYRDTLNGHLIYVADGPGPAKAALDLQPADGAGAAGRVLSVFRTSAADVAGMVKGGRWVAVP